MFKSDQFQFSFRKKESEKIPFTGTRVHDRLWDVQWVPGTHYTTHYYYYYSTFGTKQKNAVQITILLLPCHNFTGRSPPAPAPAPLTFLCMEPYDHTNCSIPDSRKLCICKASHCYRFSFPRFSFPHGRLGLHHMRRSCTRHSSRCHGKF